MLRRISYLSLYSKKIVHNYESDLSKLSKIFVDVNLLSFLLDIDTNLFFLCSGL